MPSQDIRFLLPLALVVWLGAAAGCGSSATSPSSTTEPPPAPAPDPEPGEPGACDESFDGAFDAIQTVIFERRGCTSDVCHGEAAVGGLDLRAEVAFDNLVGVPSVGSNLLRVDPTKVGESYLYLKLAAATDPSLVTVPIAGSGMPLSGSPISLKELEAIRLWIEGAAPGDGSIGDEFGGNRVADLLDACLPPPSAVVVEPLRAPDADAGVQLVMPPHRIEAASEVEICYAEYIDLRDQIPPEVLTPDGNAFYVRDQEDLADPNTHHQTLSFSGLGADMVDAPEFGRWECADGPLAGQECDPLDRDDCGGAACRSEIRDSVACVGFGPPGGANGATPAGRVPMPNGRPGFFTRFPAVGIFYWNLHAFNLTPQDLTHHAYTNLYFARDRRFESVRWQDTSHISAASGTPPFTRAEYCRKHVLPRGTVLLSLDSHTHKRGERFTIDLESTGERLYDNPFWEDPIRANFDPPLVFDSEDPAERTLVYCATFNNGVAADGSPDVGLVTRLSRKPARSTCTPVACAEGGVAAPCNGVDDHAACDTAPGAGDGLCDACPITAGLTSDDSMFLILGENLVVAE